MSKNAVVGKAHRLDLAVGRESPITRSSEPRERVPHRVKMKAPTLAPLSSFVPAPIAPEAVKPAPRPKSAPCQFPLNDGRPWRFCEAATQEGGSPYCGVHHAACYVRIRPLSVAA